MVSGKQIEAPRCTNPADQPRILTTSRRLGSDILQYPIDTAGSLGFTRAFTRAFTADPLAVWEALHVAEPWSDPQLEPENHHIVVVAGGRTGRVVFLLGLGPHLGIKNLEIFPTNHPTYEVDHRKN